MIVTYQWDEFSMAFNTQTGECITRYPGGHWSGSKPVPEDHFHATKLGITPELHRLEHELAHHLVGFAYYGEKTGSPVVYRDAHHIPQEEGGWAKEGWSEAEREEWMTTALQYLSHAREFDPGAIMDLQGKRSIVISRLSRRLNALVCLAECAGSDMTLILKPEGL